MEGFTDVVLDTDGRPIQGASVTITDYPSGSASSLYSDNGTTALTTNVVTTDALGRYTFFAADGRYTRVISKSGYSTITLTDLTLLDDPAQGALTATTISASGNVNIGGTLTVAGNTTLTTGNLTVSGTTLITSSGALNLNASASSIVFKVDTVTVWFLNAGELTPQTDNVADAGRSNLRLKTGYFGTSVIAPLGDFGGATDSGSHLVVRGLNVTLNFTSDSSGNGHAILTLGGNDFGFASSGGRQFEIGHTASAANFLQVTGAASGANASIKASAENLLFGSGSALATTATAGYCMFPSCAGTPTGVPTGQAAGKIPMIFDTTGVKLWFYTGGSWKGVVVA